MSEAAPHRTDGGRGRSLLAHYCEPRAGSSPLKCQECSGPMEEVEGKCGRYAQCIARGCRARVAVGHDMQRKQ